MSASDARLVIRPAPLVLVAYLPWFFLILTIVVTVLENPMSPLPAALLLAMTVLAVRSAATLRARVRGQADGSIEVRNRWTTRVVPAGDVDRVRVDQRPGLASSWRVVLFLTDRTTVALVATETPLPGGKRRMQRQAAELRSWITGARRPDR